MDEVSLVECARRDDARMVELALLHGGMGVNDRETKGDKSTPLLAACKTGSLRSVQVLLASRNIDINNIRDTLNSRSPLHIACERGDMKMARLLHNAGANVESKNKYSEFPIQSAEVCGHKTADVLDVFSEKRHLELLYGGGLRPRTKHVVYKWESEENRISSSSKVDSTTCLPKKESATFELQTERKIAVLDIGTCMTKAGVAGGTFPWIFERTVVGEEVAHMHAKNNTRAKVARRTSVGRGGAKAAAVVPVWGWRASLGRRDRHTALSSPLRGGIVQSFEKFELIASDAVRRSTGQSAEDESLLLVTQSGVTPSYREKMCELTFESMGVSELYLGLHSRLALYSAGRCTGCVLECGGSSAHAVPIYRSVEQRRARGSSMSLSGIAISKYLEAKVRSILQEDDAVDHWRPMLSPLVDHIKATRCEVSINAEDGKGAERDERKHRRNSTRDERSDPIYYVLPDGKRIELGRDLSCCGDLLFDPRNMLTTKTTKTRADSIVFGETRLRRISVEALSSRGIHQLVSGSIAACRQPIRADMIRNIVLTGGSSCFSGTKERLDSELRTIMRNKTIGVVQTGSPQTDAWRGGSLLASLSTFGEMVVTKAQYDEFGASGCVDRHLF